MNLDNDLSRALRRESPAPGFSSRVLARIERDASRITPRRPIWWRAAAASLTFTLLLGGGYAAHQRYERHKGEQAREQVMQALQIAGAKVRYAQQEVREIGSHD
ncbi:MAG TPA: hypothetical protein VGF48_25410 [Thermoanaerobaculia bacterium]|jgi:hypothetical protein